MMKKRPLQIYILAILVFTGMIANEAKAQCTTQYYFQKGKVIKMAIYASGDEQNGEMVYTVQNVESAGNATKATVQSQYLNKKGKKLVENNMLYTCLGDTIKADVSTYIPSASLQAFKGAKTTIEGVNLAYPPQLKEGQNLPDGSFKATTDLGVIKQIMSVTINDRKVTGKETITAAGKSWDCYKITYTCTMTLKSMISSKHEIHTTEWYCPSFGVVKTDSGELGKTELSFIGN